MVTSVFYILTPLLIEWIVSGFVYLVFPTIVNVGVLEVTAISAVFTSIVIWGLYKTELHWSEYGELQREDLRELFLLGVAASVAFNGVVFLSGITKVSESYKYVADGIYHSHIIVQILTSCILSPLMEELVYRGMVFRRMRQKVSFVPSLIISSIIFGVMHGNLVQGIYACLVGIVLGICYEHYKTLKAPYVLHIVVNFASLLFTWSKGFTMLTKYWLVGVIFVVVGLAFIGRKCWKMLQKF